MTQSQEPKQWDFTIFCLGEKKEPISRDLQIAGYQFIQPTISMKTWFLRLLFGIICWSTTLWSLLSAIINESTLPNVSPSAGEMFLLWFTFYTHWNLIAMSIYWGLVLYLHRKVYVNEERELKTKEPISTRLFITMKVFQIWSVGAGVGLSIIYWLFLYEPYTSEKYGEYNTLFLFEYLFKNGVCEIIILVDFYLGLSIWRYKDAWILIAYDAVYLLFNAIFVLAGGQDPYGNDYIYSIFDWNNKADLAIGRVIASLLTQFVGYLIIGAFFKKVVVSEYMRSIQVLDIESELAEQIDNNEDAKEMKQLKSKQDDYDDEDEKDKEYMSDLEAAITTMGTQRGTIPDKQEKDEDEDEEENKEEKEKKDQDTDKDKNAKHGVGVSGVSSVLDVDEVLDMEDILDEIPEDNKKEKNES